MAEGNKKQICVVTRHAIVNYGSFLQTLATQEIFENLGLKTTILDYVRSDEHYKNVTELLLKKSMKWNRNCLTRFVYRIVHGPDHWISGRAFEKQRKQYLHLSRRIQIVDTDEKKIPDSDIYCTGSDQVWGEIGDQDLDNVYFLDFKRNPQAKCIAFAASFGKSYYPSERIDKFYSLLEKYDEITVRENSAVDIVEMTGQKSEIILDPTLIVGSEYWNKHLGNTNRKYKKYVLIYQLNTNPKMDKYAQEFAAKANLPLVRVSAEFYNRSKPGYFEWCLSPFSFLDYIKNAQYMITDSFHGTVFAVIFHTQFIEVLPPEKQARNKSILEVFGLEDRIIAKADDFDALENQIDYDKVDRTLTQLRRESKSILKRMIE